MDYKILFLTKPDYRAKKIQEDIISKTNLCSEIENLLKKQEFFYKMTTFNDGITEISMQGYSLFLIDNRVSIIIPNWDMCNLDTFYEEITLIVDTLLNKGLTGYDPQAEKIVTRNYDVRVSIDFIKQKENKTSTYVSNIYKSYLTLFAITAYALSLYYLRFFLS